MMKKIQAPTPASVKAVEESCVTCGGAHSYRQCPATNGYTFTGYHDNIQGYVSAAVINNNYNQGYRPQGDPHFRASNQMGPPGFLPVQNNQNHFNQNQGRGNNFNQAPTYQAPTHQPQVVTQSDFQAYMKANDAVMKNIQTQMTSLTNSKIKLKSMFGQFMKMNTASSSGSGSLPSNTFPNPQEDLKAITIRSGATLAGPSVSPPPPPYKEVDQEPKTKTDQVLTESTNNVPPPVVQPSPASAPISSPKIPEPNLHQPLIPYPSRLNKEKLQGKNDIQNHSFLQMFKKIHFNISFSEALAHMPKFAKMIKDLLTNKEKLLEIAVGESSSNPTSLNPKRRNRRHSKKPFILEESPVDTMADQCTMAELLRVPTEGYAEAIVVPSILVEQFELKHSLINMMTSDQFFELEKAWDRYKDLLRACPHHGFTELHQLDTFYNALNPADQDSLNSAADGNLLERRTQDVLTIIENKSKVRNSQNKSIVSQLKPSDGNSSSSSDIAKLTHAVNQQTSVVTAAMTVILKQFQATPPPASIKSVEQICVTCGGAHPYYQCLAVDGNTFPEFQDNIQGYVSAAAINYNEVVPLSELEKIKKMNEINMKAMQTQINNVKNKKMLKALLSNKEKLLELANTPLNENCSAVILKKLPEKLGDPGKFLIPCGFSELKCKALADLGASINLMPLSTFLRTSHALIDVHREEMILRDGDERSTLNMRHDTSSYSNQPQKESINMINIYDDSCEDYLEDLFATNHLSGNLTFSSHTNLISPKVINSLSGSTTSSSSPDHLLEEFADELALITFPSGNDDLPFDIESDLREIEYLLNQDPTNEMDSILEDSVDECNLANPNDNLFDTIPEMFTDEHALDYSSPLRYDDFSDDLFELEFDNDDVYNDLFDSKEDKIKESKLLIDEIDLLRSSDFFLPPNTVQVTPYKNVKKIAISHASLILENFNPLLSDHELPFHKEVPGSKTLLLFSSENKEKVFNPGILNSKGVHTSLIQELSHRGPKALKVIKICESMMEIFPCSYEEDIRILDVPCLHFYPP
uniref:Reverse transcriptase domain-containing protein n=1 Tax=Tanacetum cinerariifolium TaxID=118510 RepID=A0A6L2M9F8_TANCI|nr:hypothetical protein [Tanacetum cinerariifolium]